MNKKSLFLIAAAAIAAAAGYQSFFAEEGVSYITERVSRKNIEKVVNATGEVKAIELVTVGAQTSGKIEYLPVKVGQKIKKGELIAQIDSTTQRNDVESTKAKLTSLRRSWTRRKYRTKSRKSSSPVCNGYANATPPAKKIWKTRTTRLNPPKPKSRNWKRPSPKQSWR